MSEPRYPREEDLPDAVPRQPRRVSFQLIWLIPILALVIGAWIATKALWERGPLIEIQFKSAEGIEANKTKIRHKAVDIGTVRSVRLSRQKEVIVTAELVRDAAEAFLAEDTRYWVVRPRIAGGQISGLTTLLAGSFIGADPGRSENEKRSFVGLETPPPITSDVPGRAFKLQADDVGSLDINSPVYLRGLLAGRVISTEVTSDGRRAIIGVFVHSPYDRLVSAETRFWNASGVDLSIDANGVKLQTQSLVPLLLGGISFETPEEAGTPPPAPPETQFRLFGNRADAMRPRETVIETFAIRFDQSVRGLAVGAPLDFRGILVGEVRGIYLDFDPQKVRFMQVVEVHLYPERLRSRYRDATRRPSPDLTPAERIQRFVDRGLRAQLRSANLLTGQLYVALDFFPKAPRASMDMKRSPPEIPSIAAGGLGELQESVQNIVNRLEKVPFEAIGQDLRKALASLDATLRKAEGLIGQISTDVAPELRTTLDQARKTLKSAEGALASNSPLQGDLRETLIEVTKAAESLRALTDYLERHPESLVFGKKNREKK
ncbi:MAG TPA: MlaD family protein [Usitatibacter sp.]|nr:MlaD family protein [Usitatibacter sp.]